MQFNFLLRFSKGIHPMSTKPVHTTRNVQRWLQRHREISEEWIQSVVLWTEKPFNQEEFIIERLVKVSG